MAKLKRRMVFFVAFVCFALSFLAVFANTGLAVSADTYDGDNEENVSQSEAEEGVSPRMFVTLSLSLNGGDGKVWATVKNDFQLFPSTVNVIVQLFYSESYCEDYKLMSLAAIDSIDDLNMGSTFTVEASTGGEELFWMARLRWREDRGSWSDKTVAARYSASGEYMGLT